MEGRLDLTTKGTAERIIEAALQLISEKGYTAHHPCDNRHCHNRCRSETCPNSIIQISDGLCC